MAKFFVNHPIIAIVISILLVIVGIVSIVRLPIAQYPELAPPEILLQATYVGADAETVEQSVATPIEQQMQGVDNMIYMTSVNASSGLMRLRVNFDVGTNANTDQILTQMRYLQAESQLPLDVRNQGVTIRKSPTSPLALFSLYSPKGTYDATFLANYAYININDPMSRVPGIGQVTIFGAGQYAMRFWVRPDTLASLGITVSDIAAALTNQNKVNPCGPDRRRACTARAAVHLYGSGAGPSLDRRGIWRRGRARQSGRFDCADEGCRSGGAGRAELQPDRPPERQSVGDHRRLPAARLQRDRHDEPREAVDG